MNDPYNDEPYDDYNDHDYDYYDYGKPDWQKFYFSFDVNAGGALSDWIKKMMEGLIKDSVFKNTPILPSGFSPVSFPVNDLFSQYTVSGGNSLLYLGNNQYGESIYKGSHPIIEGIKNMYTDHLKSNASHFLSQPLYYRSLYDILN